MSQRTTAGSVPGDARIVAARDHYQHCMQAYLSSTNPQQREVRGKAMQTALRQTLETRHRAG